METRIITLTETNRPDALSQAADLLRAGAVVAFPTKTVYGLGASLMSSDGVAGVFAAKERPADNPLIVHVTDIEMAERITSDIPPLARTLIDMFWPGPLSLVLPKTADVPETVTAGLETVVVRCPSHPIARALIDTLGDPVVAPSANRSGRVSPTAAAHVFEDLGGRIPLILDGGPVALGIESTVLDCTGPTPTLLRPGSVTQEEIEAVVGPITIPEPADPARSPGMKYRHYSPTAQLVLAGPDRPFAAVVAELGLPNETTRLITHTGPVVTGDLRTHMLPADPRAAAAELFATLRAADEPSVTHIVVEGWERVGIGAALMNRLEKAASIIM